VFGKLFLAKYVSNIIIIIIIYLTVKGLSPGGSGIMHVHKYEIRILEISVGKAT